MTDPAADTERPPPIVAPAEGLTILEDRDLPGGVPSGRPSHTDPTLALLVEYRGVLAELGAIRDALDELKPIVPKMVRIERAIDRWEGTMSDVKSHLSAREAEGKGYRNGCVGKRLLIVEDEPDLRGVLEREFEKCGVILTVVKDAEEAEAALGDLPIGYLDAAYIDVLLPRGRSGFDVASDVRDHHPACRVVLITGGDHESIVKEAQAIGAVSAVKPIKFAELKALLFP